MEPQGSPPSQHIATTGAAATEAPLEEGRLSGRVHEAVGVFHDLRHLEEAVRELEGTAFPRDAITVLGAEKDVSTAFGRKPVSPERMEDDPHTPRKAPVRPEEKAIGAGILIGCGAYIGVVAGLMLTASAPLPVTIAAVFLGGGLGAGIGGLGVEFIIKRMKRNIQRQVAHGGLILWVRTPDSEREHLACDILLKHGARHVRVHDIT